MRFPMILALALALPGCGGSSNEQEEHAHDHDANPSHPEMRAADDAAGAADLSLEGVVQVVGNDPSPQVVLTFSEDGHTTEVALVGEFRQELGMLSGATLSVAGNSVENPQGLPERAIEVTDYDLVSINSQAAYLGVLENRDGDWWLGRAEAFRLTAIPEQLQDKTGAKIWIAGPVDGNELRVQSFGVISQH